MSVKVKVENEIFDSIKNAAKFLEVDMAYISHSLHKWPKFKVKGFTVERINEPKHILQVKCLTTGKVFNTIKQAAQANNISHGSLSKALKERGGVCSRKGLEFIYLDHRAKISRTVNTPRTIEKNVPAAPVVPITVQKGQDVVTILTNITKEYLDKKEYSTVIALVQVLQKI